MNIDYHKDTDKMLSPEEQFIFKEALYRDITPSPDVNAEWERMSVLLKDDDMKGKSTSKHSSHLVHMAWIWFVPAAAAVALAIIFWPALFPKHEKVNEKRIVSAKTEHVMTTTDGSHVTEEQSMSTPAELAEVGTVWSGVDVPRGKDSHLILPDGTKVWLNSGSSLEISDRYNKGERLVRLSGNAFFEVVHNASCPFRVRSQNMETRVLGTKFEVMAYPGTHRQQVTLVEGKVAVKSLASGKSLKLVPGQEASVTPSGKMTVREVDTYPIVQRKEGYFYFDHDSMRDIMVEISRWYNQPVVFERPEAMDVKLHFVIERSQDLKAVIDALNDFDSIDVNLTPTGIVVK